MSAVFCLIVCKFAKIIVTIGVEARLGLITTLFSRLVLSLLRKILFSTLDKVINPSRQEVIGAF